MEWLWVWQSSSKRFAHSWNLWCKLWMFDNGTKASWGERDGGAAEDRTSVLASLEPIYSWNLDSGCWFPRVNFWQSPSCQRRKTCPTEKPFWRPARPSLASHWSQSEEFLSWATSPKTGTPSGLSALTPQTSSSPHTPKQVLRQLCPEAALHVDFEKTFFCVIWVFIEALLVFTPLAPVVKGD